MVSTAICLSWHAVLTLEETRLAQIDGAIGNLEGKDIRKKLETAKQHVVA